MAKGALAKSKVMEKIKNLYGDAYIGEMNGKIYVEEDDGGEKVQIAINLTCPKVQLEKGGAAAPAMSAAGLDFTQPVVQAPAVITEDERKNVQDLMARLGL